MESNQLLDYLEPQIAALIMTQLTMKQILPRKSVVMQHCLAQLSMKKGLKVHRKAAKKALKKELRQMHLRDTFEPVHFKDLTVEEKPKIVESHLFFTEKPATTEKPDGEIKARMVAGGDKQKDYNKRRFQFTHSGL